MSSTHSKREKKYVDQLLKLIKIFVMASKPKLKSVQLVVEEPVADDDDQIKEDEEEAKFTTPKKSIKHRGADIDKFNWG